ncbi:MAG: hypothetical protein K0M45_02510 [Candidatus Paracaedibacteraceae bacterium]|nr:hypothetical protein [Candidatus Paracaedibacteraceae bacterium]
MKNLSFIRYGVLASLLIASPGTAADWMQENEHYLADKHLNKIFIAGSHDSATYKLEDTFGKNQSISHNINLLKYFLISFAVTKISKKWSQAQSVSILEQLESGIWYLDLRVIFRDSKKDFYTVHGLYGPRLSKILDQINTFLSLHPKEILIIQIGDLRYMPHGDADHYKLVNTLRSVFEGKLLSKPSNSIPTLEEIWQQKKQIVLIYENDAVASQYEDIWPKAQINSYWGNSDKLNVLKQRLDQNILTQDRQANQFFVIQSQLTPSSETIKASLVACTPGYKSLKDMAQDVEKELPTWLTSWQHYKPAIIITDFSNYKIHQKIINLNTGLSLKKL